MKIIWATVTQSFQNLFRVSRPASLKKNLSNVQSQ
jgi:hypothetical protein